jgi:hypothetical protein
VQAKASGSGWCPNAGLERVDARAEQARAGFWVGFGWVRGDSEFYKTTTVVKQLAVGDVSLSVVNVNRSLFETVVRELIVDGKSARASRHTPSRRGAVCLRELSRGLFRH